MVKQRRKSSTKRTALRKVEVKVPLRMPSTTTTISSGNSHAAATHGEVSTECPPVTNVVNRYTPASGGVVSTPVAYQHPDDGLPGSLTMSRDGQGSAGRYLPVENHARIHITYVPPQPIVPIQAVLTRQTRGAPTPTTLQPGLGPQVTHGAKVPDLSQRGTMNSGPTRNTWDANNDAGNEGPSNPDANSHIPPTRSEENREFRTMPDGEQASPSSPNPLLGIPDLRPRGYDLGDNDESPLTRGGGNNESQTPQNRVSRHTGVRARINLASLNIKGRRSGEIEKWLHVPQIMREGRIGLLAVQETHLTDDLVNQFDTLFGNKFMLVHSPDPATRNAKGVAIVINRRLMKTRESLWK